MSRNSPTDSATMFDSYTIKKGNDGNIYINIPNKNNVNKWIKICDIKIIKNNDNKSRTQYEKIYNFKLLHHIYGKINSHVFGFISELYVEDSLTIGDSIIYDVSPKYFKKGNYFIYRFDQNLIASKKKLVLNKFIKKPLKEIGSVSVDYGVFVFRDKAPINRFSPFITNLVDIIYKRAKLLNIKINYPNKKYKPYPKYPFDIYEFPVSDVSKEIKSLSAEVITCNYFDIKHSYYHFAHDKQIKLNKFFNKDELFEINESFLSNVFNCNDDEPVMVMASNYFGDGSFPVLSDLNNSVVMQCGLIYNNFISRIDDVIFDRSPESNLLASHYK